jgi:hypothetical protein
MQMRHIRFHQRALYPKLGGGVGLDGRRIACEFHARFLSLAGGLTHF